MERNLTVKKVVLDCMYEACPIPLIKAVEKLKIIDIGDVIVIETDHTCALTNIYEWSLAHGFPCDSVKVADGEWRIFVEKNKEYPHD